MKDFTSDNVSKAMNDLILWLLTKDPTKRPNTKDMMNEVRRRFAWTMLYIGCVYDIGTVGYFISFLCFFLIFLCMCWISDSCSKTRTFLLNCEVTIYALTNRQILYSQTFTHTNKQTNKAHEHTYTHTYIHTYIHTCIHAYIHTYIHS